MGSAVTETGEIYYYGLSSFNEMRRVISCETVGHSALELQVGGHYDDKTFRVNNLFTTVADIPLYASFKKCLTDAHSSQRNEANVYPNFNL